MEIQVDLKFVGMHRNKPAYARPGDAGLDLFADIPKPLTIWAGEQALLPTGLEIGRASCRERV